MRLLVLLALTALALTSTPSLAAEKPSEQKKGPTRIICQSEEVLGTRLRKGRRCITAAEWAEVRRQERAYIEHGQRRASDRNSEKTLMGPALHRVCPRC